MDQAVDIKELNERIEKESKFVDNDQHGNEQSNCGPKTLG